MDKPYFIQNALKRIECSKSDKKTPLLSSLHHFSAETGRTRQKRADRWSSIAHVLSVMIAEMDLDTLAWGQWFTRHDGTTDFYTRGLDYICEKTGMNHKTVCRAISDLEAKGYLKVTRSEGYGKDGNLVKHFSLRQFTHKFFVELGFKNRTIETTRNWKRKKNEKSFYSKQMSTTCKQGIGKIQELFKKHSKKDSNKNPSYTSIVGSTKPAKKTVQRDNSYILEKAKEFAIRAGCSVHEALKVLQPQH